MADLTLALTIDDDTGPLQTPVAIGDVKVLRITATDGAGGSAMAATGVSLTMAMPDGSQDVLAVGAGLTAGSTGIWTAEVEFDAVGTWRAVARATGPTAAASSDIAVAVSGSTADLPIPTPAAPTGDILADDIADSTGIGRALLTAASSAAAQTTLDLGNIATQSAASVAITGGTLNGVAIGTTTRATAVVGKYYGNAVGGALASVNYGDALDSIENSVHYHRVRLQGTITGSATGWLSEAAPYKFYLQDNALASGGINGMLVAHVAAGNTSTTSEGQHTGLHVKQTVTGQYGTTAAPNPYMALVGMQVSTDISSTQGGEGSWNGTDSPESPIFRGSSFGLNVLCRGLSGATNITQLVGLEVEISAKTGSSFYEIQGIHVGRKADGVVQGVEDKAFDITSQIGAAGWKTGISFGSVSGGQWPIDSAGTLIGAPLRSWPVATTRADNTVAYGVDLRNVTCSGAAFASNGFSVDDAGNFKSAGLLSRNYADDVAAAAGGVPVQGLYHNNGAVRVRRT